MIDDISIDDLISVKIFQDNSMAQQKTQAQWASLNPILTAGEIGLETDTGRGKTGDGVTHWNSLPYESGSVELRQVLLARKPAADWVSSNPVLKNGQIGIESDTLKAKVGDGVTLWESLPYFVNNQAFTKTVVPFSADLTTTLGHVNAILYHTFTDSVARNVTINNSLAYAPGDSFQIYNEGVETFAVNVLISSGTLEEISFCGVIVGGNKLATITKIATNLWIITIV